MKKLLLFVATTVALCAAPRLAKAQNIQLHYDFGRHIYSKDAPARPRLTSTVEMFRPDKWGNTFFFIDMDYGGSGIRGAYWEIAREFKFWEAPFAIHTEYNGGLTNKFSFHSAFLLGGTYALNAPDFSYGFTITPMYKYIRGNKSPHSAQLTGTWYYHFAEGLCSFNGFMDLWYDGDSKAKTPVIFLSEPQFWLNLNKIEGVDDDFRLSVGTEWELSYNFAGNRFFVMPTLGLKWTF